MSSPSLFAGFAVTLVVLTGCSGSSSSSIPEPSSQYGEIEASEPGAPDSPLAKRSAHGGDDAGTEAIDGGGADAGTADSGGPDAGEVDAGTACEACSATSCAAQRQACEDDATCPQLKQCLDDCGTSACRSDCFVQYPDPDAKSKNGALYKCECYTTCAAECSAECK